MSRHTLKACATAFTMALALAAALSPTAAHAATGNHYYIELGGTGSAAPAPQCTGSYQYANQNLNGGIPVPVCYPASMGPWQAGDGSGPDLSAPSYDSSVSQGYDNLLSTVVNTHHADPGARYTIVGYSQGAQAADEVLQTIAAGGTDIPKSQVDGMLYSDPEQPGSGFWHLVPTGWSALGFTAPGTGPADFSGIPVERFCIHTDGICDATTLDSFPGVFEEHGLYWQPGNIMTQTIAHDGGNGIVWYPAGT